MEVITNIDRTYVVLDDNYVITLTLDTTSPAIRAIRVRSRDDSGLNSGDMRAIRLGEAMRAISLYNWSHPRDV